MAPSPRGARTICPRSPSFATARRGNARLLRPSLRGVTYETLLGLLAATGMRLGEAFALTRGDVELVEGMDTARPAKFDRMRLVPLHPSVAAAPNSYATATGGPSGDVREVVSAGARWRARSTTSST